MKWLSILFLASLPFGQLGKIYNVSIHDVFLVFLLIAYCFQKHHQKKISLAKPILMFTCIGCLSLFIQITRLPPDEMGVSSLYLLRWVVYAGLYIIATEKWLWGLYIGGVAFGALGLAQFILYPDLRNLSYLGWDPHYYRLFSTFLDPNFAGIYFVLTFLLGTYLLPYKKWLIIVGESIVLVSLLLTYSRSSYLALVAGLLTVVVLKKQWNVLFGICAFVTLVFVLPKTPGSTLDLFRMDSTVARFDNWQQSIQLIKKAPLFGHGFNTIRYVHPFGLDSSILFVGATTGIIGLLAYGYLLYSMIRVGRKHVWYLSSFVALGVHSLFVNSAFYPWVMIWIWIATGAVERISDDK